MESSPLAIVEAERFARACVQAAGLADRVEVTVDAVRATLSISGPDQFGLMGTTAYRSVRVPIPAAAERIGLATARHVLAEFYATDDEIRARAGELPLALAMLLGRG